ncbi:MAG TPA: MerR family transcriptional regulator [Gemmatimonadaceae bacterium]|nr:MerR family transcriptional regulator [Gemmatimonadaceae bacterium]
MPAQPRSTLANGSTRGGLRIGQVAKQAGLAPSAIRYYERLGLLPKPPRAGGKREYDPSIHEWLSLIALAKEAGFTMAETKRLVTDFTPGTHPATRWAELATRKLAEVETMIARAERMRAVLRVALDCGCFRLEDCAALLEAPPVGVQSPCVMPAAALSEAARRGR